MSLDLSSSIVLLVVCFVNVLYLRLHPPTNFPVPVDIKHSLCMMLPPPCFKMGLCVLGGVVSAKKKKSFMECYAMCLINLTVHQEWGIRHNFINMKVLMYWCELQVLIVNVLTLWLNSNIQNWGLLSCLQVNRIYHPSACYQFWFHFFIEAYQWLCSKRSWI